MIAPPIDRVIDAIECTGMIIVDPDRNLSRQHGNDGRCNATDDGSVARTVPIDAKGRRPTLDLCNKQHRVSIDI